MKKIFKFNADCANCANEMEILAKNTAGIKNAVANFMTLKFTVEFEDGQDFKKIMKDVKPNIYLTENIQKEGIKS